MVRRGCGRASRNKGGDQGDDDGPGADGPGDARTTLSSRCSDFMGPTLVFLVPPMSAPSTALAKELEQKLPLTDHASPAPAAAVGSQEGPAAVAAVSKNGLVHPALCGNELDQEKVVINHGATSRAAGRKVFQKFARLHRDTPLGGTLPSYSGRKSYTTGEQLDDEKGEEQPTRMGLSLYIEEFLNKRDTAQPLSDRDLKVKQWIKPSLVSGSGVVKKYLDKSGLQNQLGFHIVCYGCTTYIGNSRELDESVSAAIYENDIVTAAVLSGNRNFASPLDVAYYLAGSVNIGCKKEPIGILKDGKKVYFWDVRPSTEEFAELAVLEHLDECTSDGHGGY